MRVLIGALVLVLCAVQTHRRARAWRADQALWTAATVSAPRVPRPWLNLAAAEWRIGAHWSLALTHLEHAVRLADDPRRAAGRRQARDAAWQSLIWIDGATQACARPRWQSWCASLEAR